MRDPGLKAGLKAGLKVGLKAERGYKKLTQKYQKD